MKTPIFKQAAFLAAFAIAIFFAACQKTETEVASPLTASHLEHSSPGGPASPAVGDRSNPNSAVFPPTANMYGKSYAEWSAEWFKWAYALPTTDHPITDEDGSDGYTGQPGGQVFFLAGTFGSTVTRDIIIPHGKGVLFPIFNYINDYPCPDPNFEPAPGQSLEDFLAEGAQVLINLGSNYSVNLDGQDLNNVGDYRFTSDLFYFTANPDFVNWDPCVVPGPQPGVADGYWMMLKPLSHGEHTLQFHAEVTDWGWVLDVTYNITVP
jgi:hypothetical protein